ncbi:phosphatidylserine decarboxylase [Siminovitchia fortis]|uniref:phosphatidylserine decarboxylase n=1 Tax=Siminovitchia fortis TaxID=254758 RepID=A0A443J4Q4_9BACI|nr:phosphatidylserine decarboxylase [Siminovitchia fortis]RWR15296.1 phosphatidylserine decarboxylase [Siminovitchia fortis]WHY83649.1 phosphatidylserine decarboxylase [Siminovitchia fortis]
MKAALYRFFIELTNGPFTSAAIRKFTNSRMSRPFIKSYAAFYQINKEELAKDIHAYPTLHSFFTRRLKEGARKVDHIPDSVASPVDGIIEDAGTITSGREIIAKGKSYSIAEMLGGKLQAEKYEGGTYIIIYLSPSHYHRIHSPVSGRVVNCYSLGKRSFPVNRLGLKFGRSVLAKNYRVITEISSEKTTVALVKVGAMLINSVVVTNRKHEWKKGEEAAYFSFGSTVLLLFQKGAFVPGDLMKPSCEIRMGDPLGRLTGGK